MGLLKLRPHMASQTRPTKETIRNYFIGRPEVFEASTGDLRIGKDGRGKIEILEFNPGGPLRVVIYDSSGAQQEACEHINQAFDWCLGPDAYCDYRGLFDPDLDILSVVPSSEEDLDRLHALALVYFEALRDQRCNDLASRLQVLSHELRDAVASRLEELPCRLEPSVLSTEQVNELEHRPR